MTTLAPASASAVAMPRPMPEAAPVTIAVLPEMSCIGGLSRRRRSADRGAKDAQIVAAGDLAGVFSGEAAAQHGRDQVNPASIVLDAAARIELVGADADAIDPDNFGHFLQALDIPVKAGKEMPDADRAAGFGDGTRVIRADLPAAQRSRPHGRRSRERRMRQQQRLGRDLDRLLRHLFGRMRDIADEAKPVTGADHLGAELSQPLMR